eukprot:scaffold3737_cov117-Skeletonema_dohrnii-CCMP3373.AAC.5
MNQRDDHYYKATEATINLDEIASCEGNAKILQRLRDGDENLSSITLSRKWWDPNPNPFAMTGKEDEVGWLGYFIGKSRCLQELSIHYMPKKEQQTYALVVGIARNQSIRTLDVDAQEGLSDFEFSSFIAGVSIKLSQLEVLHLRCGGFGFGPSSYAALGTALRLRSGTVNLKELRLGGNIGNLGVTYLGNSFSRIAPFLKTLKLRRTSIGNDGLTALVRALANCTGLEILNLSHNNFSLAAAGLRSLSVWLQIDQMNLRALYLNECGINDEGLQALAEGVANYCEKVNLDGNYSITATGLSHLSRVLLSASCCLQRLYLRSMDIGDDGAKALGVGLAGNQSLRRLHFFNADTNLPMTPIGWSAVSNALCDTSSINNTYLLSNHYVRELWSTDVLERREALLVAAYNDKIARLKEENKKQSQSLECLLYMIPRLKPEHKRPKLLQSNVRDRSPGSRKRTRDLAGL